ncbi:molecular chaperone, partial [Cronobacter sakazakii]
MMPCATSLRRLGLAAAFWRTTGSAWSAGTTLIWPIDPYLAPGDNAAEVWRNNDGAPPQTTQRSIWREGPSGRRARHEQS